MKALKKNLFATYILEGTGEIMRLNINPFNTNNPMSLKDAFVIAALTATATYFLAFFITLSVGQVIADPYAFLFDSVKIWMQSFWGNFIVLFGLEQYMKRRSDE